jgi:putative hydrolase
MKKDLSNIFKNISIDNIPPVDFHIHTSWTDGANTCRELYDRALLLNLKQILFSEHARKTSVDWFFKFADEVRNLPYDGCRALVGVETKIEDMDGTLDSTKEIIESCDLVIASVHRFPDKKGNFVNFKVISPEKAIEIEYHLANKVIENPAVDILGHPFGMCYKEYRISPPHDLIISLIDKCAKFDVAFEINARYHSDPWLFIQWCKELDCPISIGSDAHNINEIGRIVKKLKGETDTWTPSEF